MNTGLRLCVFVCAVGVRELALARVCVCLMAHGQTFAKSLWPNKVVWLNLAVCIIIKCIYKQN